MHTLAENYKVLNLIKPQSIATTTTGSAVDVEQYGPDALVIVDFGALGGTTETFDATVETSVDGSNWVAGAVTFGQVTGSNGDNKLAAGKLSLAGIKQIRGKITMSGTSASLVAMYAIVQTTSGGASVNSTTPA